MHPINKILSYVGLRIHRTKEKAPKDYELRYNEWLRQTRKNPKGFNIFRAFRYDGEDHPENYIDAECRFASFHISSHKPKTLLDIGSYRQFILGMISHYKVTTVDVRDRKAISKNEAIITCDARKLNLADNSFDMVVSLCTLEHIGLGRYGDEFDLDADEKAFSEMVRVLKSGGRLVFTTLLTKGLSSIGFNAHRIYGYEMIRLLCLNLNCIDERFYSWKNNDFCTLEQVTRAPKLFDIYCGCWEKK